MKDNLSYGEWDMEELSSLYDEDELAEWGLEFADESSAMDNLFKNDKDGSEGIDIKSYPICIINTEEEYEEYCEIKAKLNQKNDFNCFRRMLAIVKESI